MASESLRNVELSLIVPIHGETVNIRELIARIHESLAPYSHELIIVDGGMSVGKSEPGNDLSPRSPLKVIDRDPDRGPVSSIASGFDHAAGSILGVMGTDPRHRPEMIPALLEAVRAGADIAIASRHAEGGIVEGFGATSRVLPRIARRVADMVLPAIRGVNDPHSSFFLVRREAIENLPLAAARRSPLLDVLVLAKGARIAEVPYEPQDTGTASRSRTKGERLDHLLHLLALAWAAGEVKRFAKYCAVGLSGTTVNLGLLALFTEVFGVYYLISAAVSYETSILTNFTFNELWTFRDKRSAAGTSVPSRLVKFNLVSLAGLAIHEGILWFMTDIVGLFYIFSAICAVGVVFVWNFTFNVRWTWKARAEQQLPNPGG
jgi:dolichol-phosphate mannosyltransferase